MADIDKIAKRVEALRRFYQERDARQMAVYDARTGKVDNLMPGTMPDVWPRPIVANAIDVAARQLSENLAIVPAINCTNGVITSERARKFADRRTRIGHSYIINSQLKTKLPQGCDWYLSYGSLPIMVEPDFEAGLPVMRFENPMKCYAQYDLRDRVISFSKVWREEAFRLADKFPDYREQIMGRMFDPNGPATGDTLLEVVKYCDKDQYVLYMPERKNLVLSEMPNYFGKVPIAVGMKPSYDEQERGQYDDVIYPYLARARMALLGLQATQQTVRAPLAIPPDVQRIPFGDDALIRTNNPEKIRRVGTDLPAAAFQQEAVLMDEVQRGTRTPAAASGDVHASIITGKGVEALGASYDTQISTGQAVIGRALEQALELCFEMDEKFWPNRAKTITGVISGTPFQDTYTPSKDIAGNYRVSVSYGFASGMNPNQALVFLLQLRGDQDISRDFLQRQLPMDIDVSSMQAQIDNEQTTDALKQGLFSMLANSGVMAQQGIDPTDIMRKAAMVIEKREKGVPMHQAVLDAFQPPPAPPGQAALAPPGPGGPGLPPPGGPAGGGLPAGVAPGQAEMGQGGRPDLQTMLAGLSSSGKPDLRSAVRRSIPA